MKSEHRSERTAAGQAMGDQAQKLQQLMTFFQLGDRRKSATLAEAST